MNKRFVKIKYLLSFILIISLLLGCITYAAWYNDDKEKRIMWLLPDGDYPKNGWFAIDEDNDGKGYNYYFNEIGGMIFDTITPDFKIVDEYGRELDLDGVPILYDVKSNDKPKLEDFFVSNNEEFYSEEILSQIQETATDNTKQLMGLVSSGTYLYNIVDDEDPNMPKPSDLITNEDLTAGKGYLLGKNVVLKEAKSRYGFDGTIKRDMKEYIIDGKQYSKSVKGTIFNNTKWNDAISLKGNEASITFENPKNNFNTLSGRIAMIKTTSTDRTTECELTIVDPNTEETLYQTTEFNYNSGIKFKVNFPRKLDKIRFDLSVSGQYQTRTCYMKDLKFGFDKDNWLEEQYDDEIEAEYRERYKTLIALENEDDTEEEDENKEAEGVFSTDHTYMGPEERYKGLEKETESTEDMDPDELEKMIEEEMAKLDAVSGPAFAKEFRATQSYIVGPDGSRNMYSGNYEGEDD